MSTTPAEQLTNALIEAANRETNPEQWLDARAPIVISIYQAAADELGMTLLEITQRFPAFNGWINRLNEIKDLIAAHAAN